MLRRPFHANDVLQIGSMALRTYVQHARVLSYDFARHPLAAKTVVLRTVRPLAYLSVSTAPSFAVVTACLFATTAARLAERTHAPTESWRVLKVPAVALQRTRGA